MTATNKTALPQDSAARMAIVNNISQNMLVEASAGTGKTTSMVQRMLNLIRNGVAVENIAAITFTRKAAAELQGRFYRELQSNSQNAAATAERKLFERALSQIDRCYVGTIHSYCASLLREWPFEAGVGMNFSEIDEDADKLIRQKAWNEFVAMCFTSETRESNWAEKLEEVALNFNLVKSAFFNFCEYPDVTDWPAENPGLPTAEELQHVMSELNLLRRDMLELQPHLPANPEEWGNDKLLPEFFRLPGQIARLDANKPADVLVFIEDVFSTSRSIVQRNWHDKQLAKDWKKRWDSFCVNTADAQIKRLFAYRYSLLLELFRHAGKTYDAIRSRMNVLNFQDLLMRAADMFRKSGEVRNDYFRREIRLLVDEFQDTDPIQAELMFLLTSDNPSRSDWRTCVPKPGSLFVVGDPKQSIYRFRRADIQTYNFVKKKIAECGAVEHLTCNFRSSRSVIDWVNDIFGVGSDEFFRHTATDTQAAAETMHVGRNDSVFAQQADINGVYSLTIDKPGNDTEQTVADESLKIAAFIRNAIDSKLTIVDFHNDGAAYTRPVRPGDFMIITHTKNNMAAYARALNEKNLPAQVTGGGELNGTPEIKWLLDCLRAVTRPLDPVSLIASLRSELWGFSDADLLDYKRAGGKFDYRAALPDELAATCREKYGTAFSSMQKIAARLDGEFPPVVVVEKMLEELGLLIRGAARPGGMGNIGAMCRLIELLRDRQREKCSAAELVNMLENIVDGAVNYDTIPPKPLKESPVRVMNLHKAKGLQAPVVFLACPRGRKKHEVACHIHRGDDGVKGFMAFFRDMAFGKKTIAYPAGWDGPGNWREIENGFLDAERVRLLYVAATRAGRTLVVSTHPKELSLNFWEPFREKLSNELPLPKIAEAQNEIECPDVHNAQFAPVDNVNLAELDAKIFAQKMTMRQPTFFTLAAKSMAMENSDKPTTLLGESDSSGQSWGSAVHHLLELHMKNKDANLVAIAKDVAKRYDLEDTNVDELVQTVRTVAASELWYRATAAEKCLVEVPFDMRRELEGTPALISGVIDLAFLTPQGWVLADYKTDSAARTNPSAVAEHYRPQMELYAEIWQTITGANICEMGIYLIAADRYITL